MPKPRQKKNSAPLKTFRIFCEGEKSEPLYLKDYVQSLGKAGRSTVISIEKTRKNTPIQLVDAAVKLKKSSLSMPGDIFWVVYDREAVAKYPNALHAKAFDKASANGINVALSSVCFEQWLLLHFESASAPYTCCDELLHNSRLNEYLLKITGKPYEKTGTRVFAKLEGCIARAKVNAEKVNALVRAAAPENAKPYELNPYTDMAQLLKAIDEFA